MVRIESFVPRSRRFRTCRLTDYPHRLFLACLRDAVLSWRRRRYAAEAAPRTRGRRPQGLRRGPGGHADAAGPHPRVQLFDGHQPLRPAQEPRGGGGQCHRHGNLRAELLPAADAAKDQGLSRTILEQRIDFYAIRDEESTGRSTSAPRSCRSNCGRRSRRPPSRSRHRFPRLPSPGMNDVLNSQGYTQAALVEPHPRAAWWLMVPIAVCAIC